jgi:predicted nucleotide-binding protein (sugar kinase/HSP70/actin superfamily)
VNGLRDSVKVVDLAAAGNYNPRMRVGIPRALLYFRYGRFWEKYLSGLGAEVVVSRKTDKVLVQRGLGYVSSEVCLPVKIVAGHIAALRDKVDAVWLPRMVWLEDELYACPKMIGIADIARMMLGDKVRLIAPSIKGNFMRAHFRAGLEINPNPLRVARALARAHGLLAHADAPPEYPPGEKRVALIGHFYNVEDDFVGGAIRSAFREYGYRVCLKDELPESILRSRADFSKKIRWVYERELYNAFRYMVDKVDGVCVLVSMGCGPDSLVAEFMREEAKQKGVPFLQLVLDEHTGTAGLVTRVEAFVELAERRKLAQQAA